MGVTGVDGAQRLDGGGAVRKDVGATGDGPPQQEALADERPLSFSARPQVSCNAPAFITEGVPPGFLRSLVGGFCHAKGKSRRPFPLSCRTRPAVAGGGCRRGAG